MVLVMGSDEHRRGRKLIEAKEVETFHEPTFTAALDRAESIIDNHMAYKASIRRKAMNDLYRSLMIVTNLNPLDIEIERLSTKLSRIWELPDDGKAQSAWDTTLARYERMRDYQERVVALMRKDAKL